MLAKYEFFFVLRNANIYIIYIYYVKYVQQQHCLT
jgi:hypothetical protein